MIAFSVFFFSQSNSKNHTQCFVRWTLLFWLVMPCYAHDHRSAKYTIESNVHISFRIHSVANRLNERAERNETLISVFSHFVDINRNECVFVCCAYPAQKLSRTIFFFKVVNLMMHFSWKRKYFKYFFFVCEVYLKMWSKQKWIFWKRSFFSKKLKTEQLICAQFTHK